jgi:hypothetical protein
MAPRERVGEAAGVNVEEGGKGGGGKSVEVGVNHTRLEPLENGGDITRREGTHEVAKSSPNAKADEHIKLVAVAYPTR